MVINSDVGDARRLTKTTLIHPWGTFNSLPRTGKWNTNHMAWLDSNLKDGWGFTLYISFSFVLSFPRCSHSVSPIIFGRVLNTESHWSTNITKNGSRIACRACWIQLPSQGSIQVVVLIDRSIITLPKTRLQCNSQWFDSFIPCDLCNCTTWTVHNLLTFERHHPSWIILRVGS